MGREIKRVALDFNWPLDEVWKGFINPHPYADKCLVCDGDGSSPAGKKLHDLWYGYVPFVPEQNGSVSYKSTDAIIVALATRNFEWRNNPENKYGDCYGNTSTRLIDPIAKAWDIALEARRLCQHFNSSWSHHLSQEDVDALIRGNRLWDFTRMFVPGEGWKDNPNAVMPTAKEVNDWSLSGMSHDSINSWVVISARLEREGKASMCHACNGEGRVWHSKEAQALYDGWKEYEPPAGEGWQVWETVSEGSPITPVFATREELVDYLVDGGDGWDRSRGEKGWDRAAAERFCKDEYAVSTIVIGNKIYGPGDALPEDEKDFDEETEDYDEDEY
jgi:hypothetical protein